MITYSWQTGKLHSSQGESLYAWHHAPLSLALDGQTAYGVIHNGPAVLECSAGTFTLTEGMYFSVTGYITISGEQSCGLVCVHDQYEGLFMLGGPMEEAGRLQYIDGCTDTLLIPPTILGDPCLNLLHIPAKTEQTQHTHPSLRYGMILSGSGTCITPDQEYNLSPGLIFCIPSDSLHSFHTQHSPLRVVAWHPDTDMGPTHENHPMVNKTIITS